MLIDNNNSLISGNALVCCKVKLKTLHQFHVSLRRNLRTTRKARQQIANGSSICEPKPQNLDFSSHICYVSYLDMLEFTQWIEMIITFVAFHLPFRRCSNDFCLGVFHWHTCIQILEKKENLANLLSINK